MKKISRPAVLACAMFLLISLFAVILSRPVYLRLSNAMDKYTELFCSTIQEKTGLKVSFESFSPAILSYFSIKGLCFSTEDETEVLKINSTKINYKLWELLKKEPDVSKFITACDIDGVTLDVDFLVDLIIKFTDPQVQQNQVFDINTLTTYIPSNTTVRNVYLEYEDQYVKSDISIKDFSALNSSRKGAVDFQMECNGNCYVNNEHFSTTAYLNGSLLKDIEDSFVYIKLSNLTNGTFSFNRLNFYADYKDKKIDLHTIQSIYPFYASLLFDAQTLQMDVTVKTDDLNPMNVLSITGYRDIVEQLKKSRVTLDGLYTLDCATGIMSYTSDGKIYIPPYFIPGGAQAVYNLSGDDKHLYIENMDVKGEKCLGKINLDYIFKDLQLSGLVDVSQYVLPCGTSVSSEVYFDPLDKGFMIFSPQVFVGDSSLTALQAKLIPTSDSFDFEVEVSDYSNADYGEPGVVSLTGSYLNASNYLQSNVSVNSFFLGSLASIISQADNSNFSQSLGGMKNTLKPYMFSCDAYLSTDFKSISYNVPTLVVANTEVTDQLALIAVNGNEQSIQLNRFDVIYGKTAVNSSASLDINPDTKDMFFSLDAVSSSIPYHFTGTYMSDVLDVSGDYGTNVQMRFGKNRKIDGQLFLENLPLVLAGKTILVSIDAGCSYSQQNGPSLQIARFECEGSDASEYINPKLILSGDATKYGLQLSSITYADETSSLEGTADIALNMNQDNFDSASMQVSLKNPVSLEQVSFDASVSNPEGVKLNADSLKNDLYMSAMVSLEHFSLNRFMSIKNDNNEITASANFSGTLEHPYAVVNIDKASFLLADEMANGSGSVILEDKDLTLENLNLSYPKWNVLDLNGKASLENYTGECNAIFETIGTKNFVVPLSVSVQDTAMSLKNKSIENMVVTLTSEGLSGTLIKKPVDFYVTALYTPDMVSFFSSDNLGLTGMYTADSGLEASIKTGDFLTMDVSGSLKNGTNVLKLDNININLAKLVSNFNIEDIISINSGIVTGKVGMDGDFDTPDFKGGVDITNFNFALPSYLGENLYFNKIELKASHNEFLIPLAACYIKNINTAQFSSEIFLNKWTIDRIAVNLWTLKNRSLPLNLNNSLMKVTGDVSCKLDIVFENNVFDIEGKVSGERFDIVSDIQKLASLSGNGGESEENPVGIRTDLTVVLGTHVMMNLNPVLRSIFVPNTTVNLKMDTLASIYQLDGKLALKSGDIAYLNRSFYIKEGSIKFNPDDIANPLITLKAETREKDDNGQNVRIILSAENQPLMNLNPVFSSVPAKSEAQIMNLLGQIVLADSSNVGDLLMSAGDYYFQSTVLRGLENKLRDFMNFDIFSVRTNILQNTLNMGVTRNLSKDSITIGNFLDNSTVYIGKYLGSALYVDAMLHLSLEDGNVNDISNAKGLNLKPEFGLELDLPIANIRWNMAPDINAMLNKQFVPSTSVSLSWKFTF